MNKVKRLKEIAAEFPNGFTVYTTNLQHVTKGWVVAMLETQNCFGVSGLIKALEVAENTSKVIGGWKDGERFYWDAVLVFDNEVEATKSGQVNKQIAIYNIENNKVKFL